jgi:prepilin-type N-terminal cleavage/methylation domain-containing protein
VTQRGYSLVELMVVLGVLALMLAIGVPYYLNAWQAATVREQAREIQSALGRARQLAVTTRQNVCVQTSGGGYRFLMGGCTSTTVYTASDLPANGIMLPTTAGVSIASVGGPPVFTPFGTASQTGTFRVTGPSGHQLTVSVAGTGRITIP